MIAFLFFGGAHQVFHLAPVAAALALDQPAQDIVCYHADDETELALRRVQHATGATAMRIERAVPPGWGRAIARGLGRRAALKGPLLWALKDRLKNAQAVVTPERTSSALRFMGLGDTLLIHFRHGAGDRAPASERKLDRFDLIVVPGEKDVARAVEQRGIDPAKLRVAGYVKLDYLVSEHALHRAEDRAPSIVIYNPHFDPAISSWPQAEAVIAAFAAQDRYQLVFAPHVRLAEDMNAAARARWHAFDVPGRVLVDLDSPALIDMSYIMGADIYLGDVSSQLYEFLVRPRPCAFLNTHGADWRHDPRYAGWSLGEVAERPDEIIAAIDRAVAGHAAVAERQAAAVGKAFGDYRGAAARGARIVLDAIAARGLS